MQAKTNEGAAMIEPMTARAAPRLIPAGLGASVLAVFSAVCCVLPMTFMLFGLGGAWLGVFGKAAAASPYLIALSAVLVAAAWIYAIRNGASRGARLVLVISTALTAAAWPIYYYEGAINDRLIGLM